MPYQFNPFTGNLDKVAKLDEAITHAELSDMPDAGGTNTDHDARYYTEAEADAAFLNLDGSNGPLTGDLVIEAGSTSTALNVDTYSWGTTNNSVADLQFLKEGIDPNRTAKGELQLFYHEEAGESTSSTILRDSNGLRVRDGHFSPESGETLNCGLAISPWEEGHFNEVFVPGGMVMNKSGMGGESLEIYDSDDESQVTGTVSITEGETDLTGDGTSFTTELVPGYRLRLDDTEDEYVTIDSVTDNTNAVTKHNAADTHSGVDAYAYAAKFFVDRDGTLPGINIDYGDWNFTLDATSLYHLAYLYGDAANSKVLFETESYGDDNGFLFTQPGVLSANHHVFHVHSGAIQTDSPIVEIHTDHASSDQANVYMIQDGSGPNLLLEQNGTGVGLQAVGTEAQEIIDIDRTIDANVTKSAITVNEARSGTIVSDSNAGYYYKSAIDGTLATSHYGFYGEIDLDGGTLIASSPFYAKFTAANGLTTTTPGCYQGLLGLDAISPSLGAYAAALNTSTAGSRATDIFGAWTQATNAGEGVAYGYEGYGNNTSAGTAMNSVGVMGYAASTNGIAVGVRSTPAAFTSMDFGLYNQGHIHSTTGNLYIYENTTIAEVGDKTHVVEATDGCLWVENDVEVDGTLYADGDLVVVGEIMGSRCCFDAGVNTASVSASQYMKFNNGAVFAVDRGYIMPRAGSITAVSASIDCSAYTSEETFEFEARINNSKVFSTTITVAKTGLNISYDTQARNTDAFSAGDLLTMYITKGGVGTVTAGYPCCIVEVAFDT